MQVRLNHVACLIVDAKFYSRSHDAVNASHAHGAVRGAEVIINPTTVKSEAAFSASLRENSVLGPIGENQKQISAGRLLPALLT
jgi:hypothetical protein